MEDKSNRDRSFCLAAQTPCQEVEVKRCFPTCNSPKRSTFTLAASTTIAITLPTVLNTISALYTSIAASSALFRRAAQSFRITRHDTPEALKLRTPGI